MGWRGTLRSMNAMAREAERSARRRQRELERRQQELHKMAALEQAQHEVDTYNNTLERLTSIHKECSQPVNWLAIADSLPPEIPTNKGDLKQKAHEAWESYNPNWLDKLFRKVEKKREMLFIEIAKGDEQDKVRFEEAFQKYLLDHSEWEKEVTLAKSILAKDLKSYLRAINEIKPFHELSDVGSGVELQVHDNGLVKAILHVHSENIFPKESCTLLKSGKLSVKPVPKTQFYQLYQDYVCGCTLRIANELFAILPVDIIVVTAKDELLNPVNGHMEEQAIVSVMIPRKTLHSLNMESLDPSDAMKNFKHNMDFKKASGFNAIEDIAI